MMRYEKPEMVKTEELFEGVYMASGAVTDEGQKPVCQSRYLNGIWHRPDHNIQQPMPNIEVKGCEGCSADDGNGCKIAKGGELNANGVFMPTWEQEGKNPEDLTW